MSDDDDLVTLTVRTAKPDVERQPDANVDIGGQLWRVHEPKMISWMPIIRAAKKNDMASLALDADEFLRDCMSPDTWEELRRYIKTTDGLDQDDLVKAAYEVATHYAPSLERRAEALGMAITDDEDEDDETGQQVEPAPRPRSSAKTTAKKSAKKTTKRG